MIRKKKGYVRPKKLYEKTRILEENKLVAKYGLKSKREIWKTLAKVNYFRKRGMALAKAPVEEQEVLFNKLKALGLKIESIADVLALQLEDLLERRLSTIVAKKNLAKTTKHARQLIVHKKVMIENKVLNAPSYLVSLSEENSISLKQKAKKKEEKKEAPVEASVAEVSVGEAK